MHLKRWLTSIVGIPLVGFLIYAAPAPVFAGFILLVCLISQFEFLRIAFNRDGRLVKDDPIPYVSFLIGPAIIWAAHKHAFEAIVLLMVLNLLICAFLSIIRYKNDPRVVTSVARQAMGMAYVPLLLGFVVLIRNNGGAVWIFFLLVIIFSGDTGAFYAGTYLGRHKLCPAVSPGKTIEGSVGGIMANIAAGALFKVLLLPALPWAGAILYFILVGAVGQMGDLFESEFKRASGIKDSGNILPGHGGLLDRIDAVLFAAPVTYFFQMYVL